MKSWRTRKCGRAAAVWAVVILGGAGLGFAADLFVQPDTADLMDQPGALGNVTGTLTQNMQVKELERTDDGWVKVQTADGKTGYVLADYVAGQKAKALVIGPANSDATAQMSTSLAARGLEPEAEQYSANKHLDKAALDRVIALNKKVNDAQYWQFGHDGKVGPGKPKK